MARKSKSPKSTAAVIATLRHVNEKLDPVAKMAKKAITCPVEAIALRQAALWEAYEATDNVDNPNKDDQHGTLQNAIDDNFRASSWLYPTSAVGGMFQVANAMEGIGELIGSEMGEDDTLIILERARRCLHGVMRFLEQTAGTHRTALHMDWASNEETDEILRVHRLTYKRGGAS